MQLSIIRESPTFKLTQKPIIAALCNSSVALKPSSDREGVINCGVHGAAHVLSQKAKHQHWRIMLFVYAAADFSPAQISWYHLEILQTSLDDGLQRATLCVQFFRHTFISSCAENAYRQFASVIYS